MSNKNNGGPAFPQPTYISHNINTGETTNFKFTTDGMTLRDYFAAKAMQAYFTDTNVSFANDSIEIAAQTSYRISDAMLAERIK